jgi:hypothetical protein
MAENLLILKKETVFQVQEVQISKEDEHRKQQNSVKQLSFNLKINKFFKKKEKETKNKNTLLEERV